MEAVHLYAVITHTMSHLSLVGAITVDPQVQAQQMTQNVGEEISRMIAEQKQLESRFQELIEQQHALRAVVNQSKLKENSNEVKLVSEALRESTAKLCRNLKSNPNVVDNINRVRDIRMELMGLLGRTQDELHQTKWVNQFSIRDFVEDTERNRREEEECAIEQKKLSAEVKKLKQEKAESEQQHTEEMARRRALLAKEKERLKLVKVEYEKEAIYTRRAKLGANECVRNENGAVLEQLQSEVYRLKQEIKIEETVHQEIVEFENSKFKEFMKANTDWSVRTDRDRGDVEKKKLQVEANHAKSLTEREKEREEFEREGRLKRERDELAISRKLAALFEDPAVKACYHRCAGVVQRVWRGHQIRYKLKDGVGAALTQQMEEEKRAEEEAETLANEAEQRRLLRAASSSVQRAAMNAEAFGLEPAPAGSPTPPAASDAPPPMAAVAEGGDEGPAPEAKPAAEPTPEAAPAVEAAA